MKRQTTYLILLLTSLSLTFNACSEDDEMSDSEMNAALSIESYVYANEATEYIKLTQIDNSGRTAGHPVTNASVSITQNETHIDFILSDPPQGKYVQVDTSQILNADAALLMNVFYDGIEYAFPLNFPPKIQNLAISNSQIQLSPQDLDSTVASISWDPIEGYQYCVFMRHFGNDTIPINYLDGTLVSSSAFYTVHTSSQIDLKTVDFPYYGTYCLYVTAIDEQYAKFYNNPLNQAIVETQPGGNSAWGIFAAFNGETIEIQVN